MQIDRQRLIGRTLNHISKARQMDEVYRCIQMYTGEDISARDDTRDYMNVIDTIRLICHEVCHEKARGGFTN